MKEMKKIQSAIFQYTLSSLYNFDLLFLAQKVEEMVFGKYKSDECIKLNTRHRYSLEDLRNLGNLTALSI